MSNAQIQHNKGKWRQDTVKQLKKELDQAIEAANTIPKEPGGWWHQYVCPQHHTELLYDEVKADNGEYHCPYGCVMNGEPYHGAWLVYRHQSMARHALKAAAVYAETKEEEYGQFGRSIIVDYAKQFPLYPVHPDAQPWMLKGRAFHQALTEAIWATTLLKAYLLLQDAGMAFRESVADMKQFIAMLESSMEQYHEILTVDRAQPENNYTAWLNAALSCIYAAKQDTNRMKNVLERSGGFKHHMEIAIQRDGLEFEGSIYYHIFVLRAYLITAGMLERFGMNGFQIRAEGERHIEGMLDVLTKLADPQGRLPAFHDGPYDRLPYTLEIIEVFEQGYAKYKKPEYWGILNYYYGMLIQYTGTPSELTGKRDNVWHTGLEALLYRQNDSSLENMESTRKPSSVLLEDSGFAVLRHPLNPIIAMIDFGPHGGSHGHYDKLNLMLSMNDSPISPDRGTVPYGSLLKVGWYPSTASHNTVSINGHSQQETEGTCVAYLNGENFSSITTRADGAYPGAVLIRHVLTTERYVVDWYQVSLTEKSQVDWWFHFIGEPDLKGWRVLKEPEKVGNSGGYEYIQAIAAWEAACSSGAVPVRIADIDKHQSLSAAIAVSDSARAFIVESPGIATDPSRPMKGVLVRALGSCLHFAAVYCAGNEAVQVKLEHCVGNEEDISLKLRVDAGNQPRYYMATTEGIREMNE